MSDTTQVYDTFTARCGICGVMKQYTKGKAEPHRCRIDLDAQKGQT